MAENEGFRSAPVSAHGDVSEENYRALTVPKIKFLFLRVLKASYIFKNFLHTTRWRTLFSVVTELGTLLSIRRPPS